MKVSLVHAKGWKLLQNLFKVANEDRVITFDEGRILNATDHNITKLLSYTKEAWKDKNLSEEEKTQITFLIKKIYDDAVTIAEFDNIITEQEENLLSVIKLTVHNFIYDDVIVTT